MKNQKPDPNQPIMWFLIALTGMSIVPSLTAQDAIPTTLLYKIQGDPGSARFGSFISATGDLDGDGTGDFSVTSDNNRDTDRRSTYVRVYSGRDGLELFTIRGIHKPGSRWDAPLLVPGDGMETDVDGDHVPDLMYINPMADTSAGVDSGIVRLLSGRDRRTIRTYEGYQGYVYWLGEIDQDGHADYTFPKRDLVVVYSGKDGAILTEIRRGENRFVESIAMTSDFNVDGVPDLFLIIRDERNTNVDHFPNDYLVLSGRVRGEHSVDALLDGQQDLIIAQVRRTEPENPSGGVALGDIDGDGFSEVGFSVYDLVESRFYYLAVSLKTGRVMWRRPGRFSLYPAFPGDVNGDRVDDAVKFDHDGSKEYELVSMRDGLQLEMDPALSIGKDALGSVAAFADIDGDGIREIAAAGGNPDEYEVGIYSLAKEMSDFPGPDYKPRFQFVRDEGELFVAWPAVLVSPVVEVSEDLKEWQPLYDEEPANNRMSLTSRFAGKSRYVRLRYHRDLP